MMFAFSMNFSYLANLEWEKTRGFHGSRNRMQSTIEPDQ